MLLTTTICYEFWRSIIMVYLRLISTPLQSLFSLSTILSFTSVDPYFTLILQKKTVNSTCVDKVVKHHRKQLILYLQSGYYFHSCTNINYSRGLDFVVYLHCDAGTGVCHGWRTTHVWLRISPHIGNWNSIRYKYSYQTSVPEGSPAFLLSGLLFEHKIYLQDTNLNNNFFFTLHERCKLSFYSILY